ncbi:hypothetical protein V6N11_004778 [Hibiscus sabdariffa]|uniref:CCHC-type domain-containing protein n=1 Tax=Hibiscus sabdariffa TaxID=183260 RepID=A0ABR2SHU7_9ROSI
MDCDSSLPEAAMPPVSYKDAITGGTSITDDSGLLDDDDFDLLDEDINCGIKDGIPFIDFSTRIQDLVTKCMEYALVLKADYLAVLTDRPWTIFGHYITIEPWSPEFDPSQSYPRRILAWIRLPRLPITWYKRSLLEAIGSCVGSVVKINFQTDNGRRGRFARMAVKINLNQPLVSKIVVNGRTQLVEYESLPMVCFQCGTYGHVHDQCPRNLQPEALAASTGSALVPPSPQLPAEPYGPWMLVEKRRSRSSTTSRTPLQHSNPTAENAAPVAESAACAPIITPAPENHPVAATSNTNSGARSKSAGVLRKHNPVVLGSRNLNILPLKPSVGASSSSSKLNKGRHVQKPLNSERHTAVTLDPVDPPISAARSVPQSKHPSTGTTLAGENLIHMDSSNTEIGNMNSGRSAMME